MFIFSVQVPCVRAAQGGLREGVCVRRPPPGSTDGAPVQIRLVPQEQDRHGTGTILFFEYPVVWNI